MSPISPARNGCSRPATPSIRNSRRTTPTRWPPSLSWRGRRRAGGPWSAGRAGRGVGRAGAGERVFEPSDRRRQIGPVANAPPQAVEEALARAVRAAPLWNQTPAEMRAATLERAADLYERDRAALMALIIREGGRTIPAALSEVREAADFLRYYAARARADFAPPEPLPRPTPDH